LPRWPAIWAPREPAEPERGVRMTCVVEFEPGDLEWLWADRVPLGMLTRFAGDPKLARSLVTLAMAAGFAWSPLHRVRSRIGAGTRREGFGPGSKRSWY
jgi:hypothetical protein